MKVYLTINRQKLAERRFNNYLQNLPAHFREHVLSFKHWKDAQASLLGKLLIIKALDDFECGISCREVYFNDYGRPCLDHTLDFNISHSNDFVVCAVSEEGKVGIDIEKIRPMEAERFQKYFSRDEIREIASAEDKDEQFFRYWTLKEAVLKAEGIGIRVSLKSILIHGDRAVFQGKAWNLRELRPHRDYMMHLASSGKVGDVSIEEVAF